MPKTVPVLTIDGPSGSGKGTISRHVAQALGWHYLDSGAIYRAVGLAAAWEQVDLGDPDAVAACAARADIHFETGVGSGRGSSPCRSRPGASVVPIRPPAGRARHAPTGCRPSR